MSVETKLREASESVRQARREAQFTSRSPSRRSQMRRGPILGAMAAFALVALIAVPALLVPVPDDPADTDVAASPPSAVGQKVVGGDGPYFAIDDPEWALKYAWRIAAGDSSSFILYENGDRQVSTMTGEAAEEAIIQMNELDAPQVDSEDLSVDIYQWNEGVSYVWETSDGTSAVVTFGQMNLDEAEELTAFLVAINEETFADMVATNPAPPTTLATQDTDS